MASTEISSYTITNKNGVKLTCISLGATITSLQLPDGWEDLGSSFCMRIIFRIFFSFLYTAQTLHWDSRTSKVREKWVLRDFFCPISVLFSLPSTPRKFRLSYEQPLPRVFSWPSDQSDSRRQVHNWGPDLHCLGQCSTTHSAWWSSGIQ